MNRGWQNSNLLKRVFGERAGRSANSTMQSPEFLTRFSGERIGEKQRRFFRWLFFRGKFQARIYSPLKLEFLFPFRWMSKATPVQTRSPERSPLLKQFLSNRLTQLQMIYQHSAQQRAVQNILRSFPIIKRFYIGSEQKANIAGGVSFSDTVAALQHPAFPETKDKEISKTAEREDLPLLLPGRPAIEGVRSRFKFSRPQMSVTNVLQTTLKPPLDPRRERAARSFPVLKTTFREALHYLPNAQTGSREREHNFNPPRTENYIGFSTGSGLTHRLSPPAERGQTASLFSGEFTSTAEQPSRSFNPAVHYGSPAEPPKPSKPAGISEQPGEDKVLRQGDVNWVAEEVYARIERKLRIECESKGIFF